jgi:predicted flap endonuclease-1-like 5' DNA nuclease
MSNSEDPGSRKYPFCIDIIGAAPEDTRLTVYDGWDKILKEGQGKVKLNLPRGLYRVRADRVGVSWEKVFRHEGETREVLNQPLRVSATPVFDTATSQKYYAYTSQDLSQKDSRAPLGDPGDKPHSRLFIFIRAISQEQYQGADLAAHLRLLNWQGELVSDFSPSETIRDNSYGFMAFSAPTASGPYLLRYEGEPPREMPLQILPHRSTQIFLLYHGSLRFETAKIFLPHASLPFNPDDRLTQVVDAALTTLQQGGDSFPEDATRMLLEGKFEDPMLGLLGAHLLLRQKDLEERYLNIVIGNLGHMISSSPDFQSLELLACERLGQKLPLKPFYQPPMLRAGLEAVLRFSIEYPELTPEKGLLECVAPRLYVDSPWTSWDLTGVCELLYGQAGGPDVSLLSSDWLATYLKEAIQDKLKWGREIDLKELARQAGVTTNLVANVYQALGGTSLVDRLQEWGDNFQKIRGIGPAIENTLKSMGIQTYRDLAQAGTDKVNEISSRLGRFASRLTKGDWIGQAKKMISD